MTWAMPVKTLQGMPAKLPQGYAGKNAPGHTGKSDGWNPLAKAKG